MESNIRNGYILIHFPWGKKGSFLADGQILTFLLTGVVELKLECCDIGEELFPADQILMGLRGLTGIIQGYI